MRDPNRIKPILEAIEEVWNQHPDLRLGQLMVIARDSHDPMLDMFTIEDDKLMLGLTAFFDQFNKKKEKK